jgi:hypothetical protein
MKKALLLAMAMPLAVAVGQTEDSAKAAPPKHTISVVRIKAMPGHREELKQALVDHAKAYHSGDWSWSIGEVESGADAGSFLVVEGPTSWTAADDRGDLGAEHSSHWRDKIMPLADPNPLHSFYVYAENLSTVPLGSRGGQRVVLNVYMVKPGRAALATDVMKRFRQLWMERGWDIGVWRSFASGESHIVAVAYLKDGWKDFDEDGKPLSAIAGELWGPHGFSTLMDDMEKAFSSITTELADFRGNLGSN